MVTDSEQVREREWGLYPWHGQSEAERRLVHPEDLERLKFLWPYCKVLERLGYAEEPGFIVLRYGESTFRVRPDLFQPVSPPAFDFGEEVRLRKDPERLGVIVAIHWHYEQGRPYFLIRCDRRRTSKRYQAEELLPRSHIPSELLSSH
ncbi:hypothetical protein [Vitiosangium sp. GDMCC 1.1324]|uniref:DUF6960 family protein n=1 Tax=Vitiosangium sp. (strain GDMCC 1.1324) TaxID=2138576 RepID=UPI000D38D4A7|nr:hypothetical protein [Vitiosangium sp. GDMCC 1.1324]PTL77712.1 hypothetical protein DAT35_43795 [Vitiosangium sp. GDMCC 1.1324]